MSEKNINQNVQEIDDKELEWFNGGAIPASEWNAMSIEEQNRVRAESIRLITSGQAAKCRLV